VSRVRDDATVQPPSPRIAAVLALDEPTIEQLRVFLSDSDPGVRRTAVDVLTENLCDGYGPELVAALGDVHAEVRRFAADGIRELVEVLPDPVVLQPLLESDDPEVRGAALYVLSSRRAGAQAQYRRALEDRDHRVRIEAVRALVSVDDAAGVAAARDDANREVRIAVANGLGTLGVGADTVRELIEDADPLVRAAALAAIGSIGWDDVDGTAVEGALAASAWQIRQGAARAFAGAPSPSAAVPPLSRALSDPHLDVRKAAVLSLTRWAHSEEAAREALTGALDDGDADVRAYARQALAANG
jgi:HEAT repeat protein